MADFIKQLKIKNTDGFSAPVYLGAEQRFIGALRNSSLDNLEEQYLLGVDCITTEYWQSAGTHITTKEFYDGNESTSNYYKLEIVEYPEAVVSTDFVLIKEEKLYYGSVLIATKETYQKNINDVITTKEVLNRE